MGWQLKRELFASLIIGTVIREALTVCPTLPDLSLCDLAALAKERRREPPQKPLNAGRIIFFRKHAQVPRRNMVY
jgi:hypothetical protein